MTIPWVLLAAAADLVFTMLLSAINLAIVQVGDSALQRRLERGGRAAADHWIFKRKTQVDHAVAFLRAIGRVGFFALLLIALVGLGDNEGRLTWQNLSTAFVIAASCIWLFTSVISAALARYAAVGLIVAPLPRLRGIDFAFRPLVTVPEILAEAWAGLGGAKMLPKGSGAGLL